VLVCCPSVRPRHPSVSASRRLTVSRCLLPTTLANCPLVSPPHHGPSDNGGPIATSAVAAKGAAMEDAIGASNWPLRGGKHNAYEGGVRAHAWLWDGRSILHPAGGGGVWRGLMHAVDVLPTLLGCAGVAPIAPKAGLELDGMDLSTAIAADSESPRSTVILDIELPNQKAIWGQYGDGVVRKDIGGHSWKLMIKTSSIMGRPGDWSNKEPWFNVTASEPAPQLKSPYELFDVAADPSERHDLCVGSSGPNNSWCRNNTGVPTAVFDALVAMYEAEKAVAVYPFIRGKKGKPDKDGVWTPWLDLEKLQELGGATVGSSSSYM
jgi:hypothetical protein